jgi:hypothetical protein
VYYWDNKLKGFVTYVRRSLESDRRKLILAVNSLRRGVEESKSLGKAAAVAGHDDTFVAPPSVERKVASGLGSYIHYIETRRLQEESVMKELHEATVRRMTAEFKVNHIFLYIRLLVLKMSRL